MGAHFEALDEGVLIAALKSTGYFFSYFNIPESAVWGVGGLGVRGNSDQPTSNQLDFTGYKRTTRSGSSAAEAFQGCFRGW